MARDPPTLGLALIALVLAGVACLNHHRLGRDGDWQAIAETRSGRGV